MGLINTERLRLFLDKVKVLINTKADVNHTHSNYAASSHTHSYLPLAGGTLTGNVNVQGVIRANGNQVAYDNGEIMLFGTTNRDTTVCCATDGDVTVQGGRIYAPSLVPRANNSFQIGNSSSRYKSIYLVSQPNVSSDERCKRNICDLPGSRMLDFINRLDVVEYNYKDDSEDAEKRIGVIAQAMLAADPEIAKYFVDTDENGYYSLRPADLVFPLIAAVQELSKR